jgi:SAM-dependent methyltransferase
VQNHILAGAVSGGRHSRCRLLAVCDRLLRALIAVSLLAAAGASRSVEIAAPFVPTAPSVVERMLEIARVTRDDYVIDLGSGDGRIVIAAARTRGATGLGIEIDSRLVTRATANARAAGVGDQVRFVEGDLFAADLSQASVITIYLMTRATLKLRDRLLALAPGTRIVSNATSMGEWRPDHFEMLDVPDRVRADAPRRTYVQLWIVPARVAGIWRWSADADGRVAHYELAATQRCASTDARRGSRKHGWRATGSAWSLPRRWTGSSPATG